MTKELKLVFGMKEKILGKGENAGNQHFLLSRKCFQKPTSLGGGCQKLGLCGKGLTTEVKKIHPNAGIVRH